MQYDSQYLNINHCMKATFHASKYNQQASREDCPKLQNNTPLLARLENEYLFAQQKTNHQDHRNKVISDRPRDKENSHNMINSVPANYHNQKTGKGATVVKIDNYENMRFKTHHGYSPMMTKSRYGLESDDSDEGEQAPQKANVEFCQSLESWGAMRNRKNLGEKRYESINFDGQDHDLRPLTFGLIKKTEPLKTSVEYKEDKKLKNLVLDEIEQLRKSQQSLALSKDCSASGFNVPRCSNHVNKRAKYRLMGEIDHSRDYDEEEMIYCSKCAINLLQQGFKVEELPSQNIKTERNEQNQSNLRKSVNPMLTSVSNNSFNMNGSSRLQEMRSFQQKLNILDQNIHNCLLESPVPEIQDSTRKSIAEIEQIYSYFTNMLQEMKEAQIEQCECLQQTQISNWEKYQKDVEQQRESIIEMKREMKEYRNKFIIMKEGQFQFLMASFLNKIEGYGKGYQLEGKDNQYMVEQRVAGIVKQVTQEAEKIRYCSVSEIEDMQKKKGYVHKETGSCISEANMDDFICQEIKRPFRTLFPDEESQCSQSNNSHFPVSCLQDSESEEGENEGEGSPIFLKREPNFHHCLN